MDPLERSRREAEIRAQMEADREGLLTLLRSAPVFKAQPLRKIATVVKRRKPPKKAPDLRRMGHLTLRMPDELLEDMERPEEKSEWLLMILAVRRRPPEEETPRILPPWAGMPRKP